MKAALKSENFCMVLAVAALFTRLVGAAPLTLTWSGGSSGNLSDETWIGGVEGHLSPQNGDTLVFSTGGTFTSDVVGLEVAALTFSSSSAVTISGSCSTRGRGALRSLTRNTWTTCTSGARGL